MVFYGVVNRKNKKNKKVAVLKTFKLYKNILRMVETAFALGDV